MAALPSSGTEGEPREDEVPPGSSAMKAIMVRTGATADDPPIVVGSRGGLPGALDSAALPTLYWASRRLARCDSGEAVYDVLVAGAYALAAGAVALYVPVATGSLRLAARQGWPDEPPAELAAPEGWLA